ncbi:hypothetical protein CEXT_26411 [Caerostris extrusa]|uniref:Uncharacterized protein n=1 Tax=Caerostris extrusa TaxID=172846 RepID=A0AAV4VDF9_CAEEX|nr:hypothetical protein CEXT_26411 [Caerostris extrusa]
MNSYISFTPIPLNRAIFVLVFLLVSTWISFQIPMISSVAKSPDLPSPPERREENPFRITTIPSKPLHPLSFPWKRASRWREEQEEDWQYKISPYVLIQCRQY